ncbi:MAG: hypothetical protein IJD10_02440, partial [Clostridia bacterium]|nr:hypothetical protein [Clostridia bacterium]
MSKTTNRIVSLLLAGLMLLSVCLLSASCTKEPSGNPVESGSPDTSETTGGEDITPPKKSSYTYKSYTTALGTNWNPHTWDTNADQSILGYLSSPFVTMSILDSENGVFQWVYEMATSITDVTKDNVADLTKYNVTLPEGTDPASVEAGYVFEIKLNPNAKWENGEAIKADDYIESMKRLLDSKMRNYRANLYIAGESAVAGGNAFYNSEAPIYAVVVPAYGEGETPDYSFDLTSKDVYINPTSEDMTIAGYSFGTICNDYGYINGDLYKKIADTANSYGYVKITEDNKADILEMMDQYLSAFGLSIWADAEKTTVNNELYMEFLFYF